MEISLRNWARSDADICCEKLKEFTSSLIWKETGRYFHKDNTAYKEYLTNLFLKINDTVQQVYQNKLHHRNMQIKDLKNRIAKYVAADLKQFNR